jgi:hypothetical protein
MAANPKNLPDFLKPPVVGPVQSMRDALVKAKSEQDAIDAAVTAKKGG